MCNHFQVHLIWTVEKASEGYDERIKLLLKYHVDMTKSQFTCSRELSHEDKDGVSDPDYVNKTPLEIAVTSRQYDTVELLLAADACLNQVISYASFKTRK